ncbi:ketopantoate reductase family protein [Methylobrevis pamukkalensis]|uniref:2-dehydropantoate 2-reductase n=1 Tax=Methylobrevis pamukkalensis TaxID=1439726 RepID=A0A1E3H1N9_9HYPH|nr:2-dehydropantoate 2-reductase [Methylobrevis pamukkalensis]ODN70227.1 2-dehydropantoate 2-reductase [Methylobrevis pamukkalensis]
MKIAIMGAGAVGCYYGAMLARAGHAVTLIGRPAHVEAMAEHGLVLETAAFRESVAVQATSEADGVAGAELVLFCVKSTDTLSAGAAMAPHLSPSAAIWSLQNGVDNAERLAAVLGRPVTPVVVYVASEMAGPGHVLHHGRGDLVAGVAPDSAAIAERFTAAGVPTTVSADAVGALWSKLVMNCAYNALSAITQLPYGQLAAAPGVLDVMRDVVDECLGVAAALGIAIPGDAWSGVVALSRSMPGQYSSTAQDLARGKRSEIDHLNGHVVEKGAALGIPTPANRTLHTLVKLLEAKKAG